MCIKTVSLHTDTLTATSDDVLAPLKRQKGSYNKTFMYAQHYTCKYFNNYLLIIILLKIMKF